MNYAAVSIQEAFGVPTFTAPATATTTTTERYTDPGGERPREPRGITGTDIERVHALGGAQAVWDVLPAAIRRDLSKLVHGKCRRHKKNAATSAANNNKGIQGLLRRLNRLDADAILGIVALTVLLYVLL
jgi:hypothetical protein